MNGLIRFSLRNRRAITVFMLTIVLLGLISVFTIAVDILPVYNSPAVQALTFYGGMPASTIEADITSRMERWCGQAAGQQRQESRSIVGASIVRNYYTDDTDPNGALAQVMSLATAAIPGMPPGTLPPVVLPYDPTASTPVILVALNSRTQGESALYDCGRYEVRNFIMASKGANSPVVYGGKIRTILAYLNRQKLQARNLSAIDVLHAIERFNIFMPAGDVKIGATDYALESNSMYEVVQMMGEIPIKIGPDNKMTLVRDVADTKDASLIQTNVVRVDGRRQVYIPVYRTPGASTLSVVNTLRRKLPEMQQKLTTPDVELKPVMDQSVYVKKAIESMVHEGILGAVLCSLVILVFLGEWRMTVIAVLTIPVAVLGAVGCLSMAGQTINVMTLAGLALAIGPLVDSAIICLENTHRHLGLGAKPRQAAFLGASEVAMPELIASLCTLLVLAPLAFMPGMGKFLFRPMFLAVTFAMVIAYILSRTFVPSRCANWLSGHGHKPIESDTYDYEHRNEHENAPPKGVLASIFEKWEGLINRGIAVYVRVLERVLKARVAVIASAFSLLALVIVVLGTQLRQEFFPEVDAGAFEISVRAKSGTRIEVTESQIAQVEKYIKNRLGDKQAELLADSQTQLTEQIKKAAEKGDSSNLPELLQQQAQHTQVIQKISISNAPNRSAAADAQEAALELSRELQGAKNIDVAAQLAQQTDGAVRKLADQLSDLEIIVSEIGLSADWSAAFTQNAGPMDTMMKIQLKSERTKSAQEYVEILRRGFQSDPEFLEGHPDADLEFAFDAGGMIRAAMNEGRSTPINVRITTKRLDKARKIAEKILEDVKRIDGVVDARIMQRLDYPAFKIKINQTKASLEHLSQIDVMQNLVAVLNSSVQFNKHVFWIDPKSHNQYFVGVQYPEQAIASLETLRNIQITGPRQPKAVPLGDIAEIIDMYVPSEVTHTDLQPTMDLSMGIQGRDLGHVAADVEEAVAKYGKALKDGGWRPYDPDKKQVEGQEKPLLEGARVVISGEYQKMQTTFTNQAIGMILAVTLIYFLMVALFKSYVTPLVVLCAVPIGLVGVILMLYITKTPLNVQSLLGVIFMVGIVVSNTVLLTDFAQNLRKNEGMSPTEAIRRAAGIRVRPVVMTALATFFALIPMSLGLGRGSEANVPLGRAVLGGLLAGMLTTLLVVPAVYSLLVHGKVDDEGADLDEPNGHEPNGHGPNGHGPTPNNGTLFEENGHSEDYHPA